MRPPLTSSDSGVLRRLTTRTVDRSAPRAMLTTGHWFSDRDATGTGGSGGSTGTVVDGTSAVVVDAGGAVRSGDRSATVVGVVPGTGSRDPSDPDDDPDDEIVVDDHLDPSAPVLGVGVVSDPSTCGGSVPTLVTAGSTATGPGPTTDGEK